MNKSGGYVSENNPLNLSDPSKEDDDNDDKIPSTKGKVYFFHYSLYFILL